MEIGTIQTMKVIDIQKSNYILEKDHLKTTLAFSDATKQLTNGESVEVFIFKNKATMHLPTLTIDLFNWVTVCKRKGNQIYVDIGTNEPVIVANTDLPAFESVWPEVGDTLYVMLKRNRQHDLFVVPAKERQFSHLISFAENVNLNDIVTGTVIRTAREGTVILSDEGYRCFIHRTEREKEPRLGEKVTCRVIEVK